MKIKTDMKNILLLLFSFFLISATIVSSSSSDKSTSQKIIIGKDLTQIKIEIQKNYDLGFRVVSMVSQNQSSTKDEVLVVMEK